jgi:hypothetical protein
MKHSAMKHSAMKHSAMKHLATTGSFFLRIYINDRKILLDITMKEKMNE